MTDPPTCYFSNCTNLVYDNCYDCKQGVCSKHCKKLPGGITICLRCADIRLASENERETMLRLRTDSTDLTHGY